MILDADDVQPEEPAPFPRTRQECRAQGQADYRAGMPSTWTPNLGPLTTSPAAWRWWYEGWCIEALADGKELPDEP